MPPNDEGARPVTLAPTVSVFADNAADVEDYVEMEELGKNKSRRMVPEDEEEDGGLYNPHRSFEEGEQRETDRLQYEEQEFKVYTQEEEKRVLKKLDRRVVLFVA